MSERQEDQRTIERLRRENLERASAPKDNEVDDKVMPEPLTYGMRRRGETAVIGLIPPKVHANPPKVPEYLRDYEEVPLYSAATVAELRAEVESERKLRLRAEGLCSQWITRHDFALESLNELTADRNAQRDRADAAERRLSEVREIQRTHYGDGIGLHVAMILWTRDYDALTGADPT